MVSIRSASTTLNFSFLFQCEDDSLVYLFRKGGKDFSGSSQKKYKAIPPVVQNIVKDPSIVIPFEVSKR